MKSSIQKGAIPYKGGCRFIVWAPHAEDVFVIGSFNDWENTTHRMKANPDGWWSIDIPGVEPEAQYQYRIINAGKEYIRIDPYVRQVTNSVGKGIIPNLQCMNEGEEFTPPTLNEMVIYELHIGTFGKQDDEPGPATSKVPSVA